MSEPRISCAVAACHRTMLARTAIKRHGSTQIWFLCPVHWARLTRVEKRVIARLKRQRRRFGHLGPQYARIINAAIRRAGAQ